MILRQVYTFYVWLDTETFLAFDNVMSEAWNADNVLQANESVMALATQNKLLELDVGLLLHPPTWLSDENEYDIEMLKKWVLCPCHEQSERLKTKAV